METNVHGVLHIEHTKRANKFIVSSKLPVTVIKYQSVYNFVIIIIIIIDKFLYTYV